MTRPWLTLPPLLADHARAIRLLHLTTAELRGLHSMPPAEESCWRTTPEGRELQTALTAALTRRTGGDEHLQAADGLDVSKSDRSGTRQWRFAYHNGEVTVEMYGVEPESVTVNGETWVRGESHNLPDPVKEARKAILVDGVKAAVDLIDSLREQLREMTRDRDHWRGEARG